MLDEYRFGLSRKQLSMSWFSQLFLTELACRLFSSWPVRMPGGVSNETKEPTKTPRGFIPHSGIPKVPIHYAASEVDEKGIRRFLLGKSPPSFHFGDEVDFVDVDDQHELYSGSIIGVSNNGSYDVAFYTESIEEMGSVRYGIDRKLLIPRDPIKEGTKVIARYQGKKYFPGTVVLAVADGSVDVEFDDGDAESNIPLTKYYRR
jgi:hypothetical protein